MSEALNRPGVREGLISADLRTLYAVDDAALTELMHRVRTGAVHPDDAVADLSRLPFADLGVARIDHHRALRQGLPEAVYGPGKSPEDCVTIVAELLEHGTGPILVTRTTDEQQKALNAAHPGAQTTGRLMVWRPDAPVDDGRTIAVVTAGTADLPVADEAAGTLEAHGRTVDRVTDVGVAGLHRLLAETDRLMAADIVIVVAGMEGALASVLGGLSGAPVIAVPTSVGYGAGLEGVTALLGMLASCAAGLAVVGIDNGYGAAVAALRQLRMAES